MDIDLHRSPLSHRATNDIKEVNAVIIDFRSMALNFPHKEVVENKSRDGDDKTRCCGNHRLINPCCQAADGNICPQLFPGHKSLNQTDDGSKKSEHGLDTYNDEQGP